MRRVLLVFLFVSCAPPVSTGNGNQGEKAPVPRCVVDAGTPVDEIVLCRHGSVWGLACGTCSGYAGCIEPAAGIYCVTDDGCDGDSSCPTTVPTPK